MKNSYIIDQLWSIQQEYCNVLKIAAEQIDTDDFSLILDEISVFWFSKREVIQLILNYIYYDYDCFLFTGASVLDVENNEHFPFVLMGDIRIIDDPLTKFITIPAEIKNVQFHEKIAGEIKYAIYDSIEILDNMRNEFAILPITQASYIEKDTIQKGTEQAFWSLFNDEEMNFEKYRNEINTIEQVKSILRTDVIGCIVFSNDTGESLSFEEHFNKYRKEVSPFDVSMSDSMVFFYVMNGFISQALNILLTCSQYSLTPYLRYKVSFKYTMLIGSIFSKNQEISHMLNRAAIAHICYFNFDKDHISSIDFDKFVGHIRKYQINNELKKVMNNRNSSEGKYQLKDILVDIEEILKKVYLCVEK